MAPKQSTSKSSYSYNPDKIEEDQPQPTPNIQALLDQITCLEAEKAAVAQQVPAPQTRKNVSMNLQQFTQLLAMF